MWGGARARRAGRFVVCVRVELVAWRRVPLALFVAHCCRVLGRRARAQPPYAKALVMGGACSANKPTAKLTPASPSAEEPAAGKPATSSSGPALQSNGGRRGQLSLSKVLLSPEASVSGALMAYARADMSEENLEFWYAIEDFRRNWDGKLEDETARTALCNEVITQFLKAGSPKQVCIGDNKVKLMLERADQGHYAKEMFDEPQAIAKKTLIEDIFPRFEESEAGKALATRADLCDDA